MDDKLLNLPWQIQLALGSGYLAYMLAYLGIRDHHKPIDVTFRTIAFGLCATAALTLMPPGYGWWRIPSALAAALVGGIIWRLWLADLVQWAVRKIDLSWSDETPSAWSRITQHNRRMFVSQIAVQLDDESWLFCDDTQQFSQSPYGPCVLGPQGDVALYVTHKGEKGSEILKTENLIDPHHGHELTYVPASRVRQLRLRMLKGASGKAQVAEAFPEQEEVGP